MKSWKCPICESHGVLVAHGLVAPWISELNSQGKAQFCHLFECGLCNFRWFDHRFDEKEMQNIYSNYRQGQYLRVRHKWEPWFSTKEAQAFGEESDKQGFESRKYFMNLIIRGAGIDYKSLSSCLDYGGDLGQFIPAEIVGKKFILDPSSRSREVDGILHVSDLSQVGDTIDFIMNCHTIEHLPNFKNVIDEIYGSVSKGGYLYLEVPQDSFKTRKFHKTRLYLNYLRVVRSIPPLFVFIDFISGLARQLGGRIPVFGIVKQSEHINYFDSHSVVTLLKLAGFKILPGQMSDRRSSQGRLRLGRLGIAAQKSL